MFYLITRTKLEFDRSKKTRYAKTANVFQLNEWTSTNARDHLENDEQSAEEGENSRGADSSRLLLSGESYLTECYKLCKMNKVDMPNFHSHCRCAKAGKYVTVCEYKLFVIPSIRLPEVLRSIQESTINIQWTCRHLLGSVLTCTFNIERKIAANDHLNLYACTVVEK